MVKRFVAFGSAVLLALSFSVFSFAASTSTVSMGYPYFGYGYLRSGTSYIYSGTKGSRPITSIAETVPGTVATGSSLLVDLFLGGNYTVSNSGSTTFSYTLPVITQVRNQGTDYEGTYDPTRYNAHYTASTTPRLEYLQPYGSYENFEFSSDGWYSFYYYGEDTYTADVTSAETINLQNNVCSAGDYVLTGYFDFPTGTFSSNVDLSNYFTSIGIRGFAAGTGERFDFTIDHFDLGLSTAIPDTSHTYQRVTYVISYNVPVSVNLQRFQFAFYTSNFTAPVQRFGLNTGAYDFVDNVSGIGGLSAQLASFFSDLGNRITSGFENIGNLLRQRDEDAAAAVDDQITNEISEATSMMDQSAEFEDSLSEDLGDSLDNIDLTVPTSTSAVSAISYIFTSIFSALGAFQSIVIVPLAFGLCSILFGLSYRGR